MAVRDPAARRRRRSARRAAGRGGGRLPAVALAPLPHPARPGAVRRSAGADRSGGVEAVADSRVLDLGCGGGGPATRALAARHDVVGVDISERQLERARRLVPDARFLRADATEVAFPPESFDAVVSLFLLGHVPRAKQRPLLERIFGWLAPGGRLLATLGTANADDEI